MLFRACTVAVLVIFSLPKVLAEERDFDRQDYGENSTGLPLWSPMRAFESGMVSRVRETDNPLSSQELLQLYLLASGDVRSAERATELSASAWNILASHDYLRDITDEAERGSELLKVLH